MDIEGGDNRKVEIFFPYMLLDVNFLSPIWRYRGEKRNVMCVWVGGMIDRDNEIVIGI